MVLAPNGPGARGARTSARLRPFTGFRKQSNKHRLALIFRCNLLQISTAIDIRYCIIPVRNGAREELAGNDGSDRKVKKLLLAGMMLAFAGPLHAEVRYEGDKPWLNEDWKQRAQEAIQSSRPDRYKEQMNIPNPFDEKWFGVTPPVAQVQTFYVYPTMQDAPSWLTRKYKIKPRMHR